jgi:hypothetical protein
MFQVNTLLLNKFGWKNNPYGYDNKLKKGYHYTFTSNDTIFGIAEEDNEVYFVISKKHDYKKYPIQYNFRAILDKSKNRILIKSNIELFGLIKQYDACNKDYQRHFRISSILNKDK